ncbi:MAG TPA: glycosyltransferase family 4 protein [Thermoleophilaceae bacterium]|nr:glycosyltransferase family 4 protein [Thermoleophilaceae bacterium]
MARVLVVHNRYRIEGGEERSVELQLRALRRAGVAHRLLERRSADVGRARAAFSLVRGGDRPSELADAARELEATVVHVHNMQPLVGPRGLAAAREAGARVVLHLHNLRLFCAIAVAARDGGPCFRCHGRNTLPGLVLNCRGSLPEAAIYAGALSAQQPAVFAAVDRFLAPSIWAAGQLGRLGAPSERIDVLPHYLPAEAVADRSRADRGGYALVAARLSPEKGLGAAVEAAAATGVPLRIAGQGPERDALERRARELRAPVTFLGRIPRDRVASLLAGAGAVLLPSNYHEFSPYAVLEAMAAGVPVLGSAVGGVPELVGAERVLPRGDTGALSERLRELWAEPERRRQEGDALIARVRRNHSEELFLERLLSLYRAG